MEITREMVMQGMNKGIIRVIDGPEGEPVCRIDEPGARSSNFFRFTDEKMEAEEYLRDSPLEKVAEEIANTLQYMGASGRHMAEYSHYERVMQHNGILDKKAKTMGAVDYMARYRAKVQEYFSDPSKEGRMVKHAALNEMEYVLQKCFSYKEREVREAYDEEYAKKYFSESDSPLSVQKAAQAYGAILSGVEERGR